MKTNLNKQAYQKLIINVLKKINYGKRVFQNPRKVKNQHLWT